MVKEQLELSMRSIEILLIVFGVLVAIGVAGESIYGFLLWRRNAELKTLQEREIALLTSQTAEAQKRALELQALVQPRDLNEDQRRAISEGCKRFSGRMAVVTSNNLDLEGWLLAHDLIGALEKAGVHVK